MRIPFYYSFMLLVVVLACATLPSESPSPALPSREASLSKKAMLWGTHYYSHVADVVGSGYPLYDKAGNAISPKISKSDYCLCGIEGTCTIDGQVYDYSGVGAQRVPFTCAKYSGHKIYWSKGKFKYGKGNKSNPLEPFVSVAADQKIYKFGTWIYIPSAKGLALPSGKVHDGFFRVDDVGGAIKGNHLDFFTGPFYREFKFPFVKSSSGATFPAYIQ